MKKRDRIRAQIEADMQRGMLATNTLLDVGNYQGYLAIMCTTKCVGEPTLREELKNLGVLLRMYTENGKRTAEVFRVEDVDMESITDYLEAACYTHKEATGNGIHRSNEESIQICADALVENELCPSVDEALALVRVKAERLLAARSPRLLSDSAPE